MWNVSCNSIKWGALKDISSYAQIILVMKFSFSSSNGSTSKGCKVVWGGAVLVQTWGVHSGGTASLGLSQASEGDLDAFRESIPNPGCLRHGAWAAFKGNSTFKGNPA